MSEIPEVLKSLQPEQLVRLDVRPVLAGGTDPFQLIMEKIAQLEEGQVLEIVNTFKPAPLMNVLQQRGFSSFAEVINDQLVHTYFYKEQTGLQPQQSVSEESTESWESLQARFKDAMVTLDVRQLEMPRPMISILEAVDVLSEGQALFVYHKKLPVFLLPELATRKLQYRINEVSPGDVQLLIYRS